MEDVVVSILETLTKALVREAIFQYGIGDQVDGLTVELRRMKAFLRDADRIRDSGHITENLVQEIGDLACKAEDIVETFVLQALQRKRRGFMGRLTNYAGLILQLRGRHEVGRRIEGISNQLGAIARGKVVYDLPQRSHGGETASSRVQRLREMRRTSPLEVERDLVGIEEKANSLKQSLMDGEGEFSVVSVVGMGGVGKTTLIKKVYNEDGIKLHFNYFDWVCVSQTYSMIELLCDMIIKVVGSTVDIQNKSEQLLKEDLHKNLSRRRYLIVLDDMWDISAWVCIREALPDVKNGSRVVITTRNEDLAKMVERNTIHVLKPLPYKESWELLCKKAFVKNNGSCPEYLRETGHGIVERCGGLPLALVVIGGLLSTKLVSEDIKRASEWKKTLDGFSHYQDRGEVRISEILSLSYFDLPNYLKPCFLYLSAYPEDFKISRTKIVQLWVSEGFIEKRGDEILEDVAEDYLEELASRSMIQVESVSLTGRIKSCVVHDLMRDMCLKKAGEHNFLGLVAGEDSMPSQKTRRLAFHQGMDVHVVSNPSKIRSFLFFSQSMRPSVSKSCLHYAKLVRVLLLENIVLKCPLNEVGSLVLLRCLSFRGSSIRGEIPKSIRALQHLEVFDMRPGHFTYDTICKSLKSSWSLELPSLRHFYANALLESVQPMHLKAGTSRSLQTLWGVWSGIIREPLSNFSQLRKVGIKDEDGEINEIYGSIGDVQCLRFLSLWSNVGVVHNLEAVSRPPLALEKLLLRGKLGRVPSWFGRLPNLTKLLLWWSELDEEGFSKLQELPQLKFLELRYRAYVGKEMHCIVGGFPRLQHLEIWGLEELEEWRRLEEGSMACLQFLQIYRCGKLRMLPQGLEHVPTLQRVKCSGFGDEFSGRVLDDAPHHLWRKTISDDHSREWKRVAL
ncbi:disease resistance RPP8-like protein 3 [Amborella trichopoda]|uniref:NB-ARC domain-containing protein n=1 Tax=Amborella trichopoda TaxID=13333 RepID=U5CVB0_AMBTC|nr:disease resistance RPP8-like protein 3 [Amborella trichopoda]ERM98723.1 hypothetical protein AMTR_s02154p00002280 [Amborella trichopoda]|eukprot:XP_006833445.1 disease resistance RPP8-like protein 3 [Amborella trichopoda]